MDETAGGKAVLEKAASPLLYQKRVFFVKSEFEVSLASSIGALLNAGRRLAYN